MARTHSLSSYAGYHTPIEDELAGGSMIIEGEGISEIPSDNGGLNVGRGSYHTQVCSFLKPSTCCGHLSMVYNFRHRHLALL